MLRSLAALCLASTLAHGQDSVPAVPKQDPAPASAPAAPAPEAPAPPRRSPSTALDINYYNNNPVFDLELDPGRKPLWSKNLVDLGFKVYDPSFTQERILLCDKKRLVAMDPSSGAFTWEGHFERDLDLFVADGDLLVYADHRIGLMGGKSWLHGYSMQANKELWVIDSWQGAMLQYFDEHIYRYSLTPFSSTLHCLSRDGKEAWSYKTSGYGRVFFTEDLAILAPPPTSKIIALKRTDGSVAWTRPLGDGAFEQAVHNSVLYLTRRNVTPILGVGGTIFTTAVDLRTGKELWQYTTSADDGWFHEQIGGVVSNGEACVLNTNRRLIGLDAKTGRQLWVANPATKMEYLASKPIILNGTLFAIQTIDKKKSILQFLNLATGEEVSRAEIPDEVVPPAKVVGKALFLCFRHGDMLALALKAPEAGGAASTGGQASTGGDGR